MGTKEYKEIRDYELGLAPWTETIEQAYLKMYASFVFGEDSLENVPLDWWEEHRKEYLS